MAEVIRREGARRENHDSSFLTFTGRRIWPLDPRPEHIAIEDVAHALAHQCRFAGHTRSFYSIAQHSVLVSRNVPPPDAMWGLLHDASEAYLCDVPAPVKHGFEMKAYRMIEARMMAAIVERFDLATSRVPITVELADKQLLATEFRDLHGVADLYAVGLHWITPLRERIEPAPPPLAERLFLDRFEELSHFPPRFK